MMFYSTVCNSCGKQTIIDMDDEVSYCMHCGVSFSEGDLADAEQMSTDSFESMMYSDYPAFDDYSDRPWFDSLVEITNLMDAGDMTGAAEAMDALMGSDPENRDLTRSGQVALITWMGENILACGSEYRGGAMEIARVLGRYDAEFYPSSVIYGLVCMAGSIVGSLDTVQQVMSAVRFMFVVTAELATVESDIRMILDACTEFMHSSSEGIEAADGLVESDEEMEQVTDDIYRLQDFIRVFGDGIFDSIPSDESKADELMSVWEDLDVFEIGAKILDLAVRRLDGDVSPEEIKAAVDEYTFEYMSVLPA